MRSTQTYPDSQHRTEIDARVTDLRRKLAMSGHRITPQRLCILRALLDGPSHPSADQIFEKVQVISPTTSLATVYKTLQTLKEMGEVIEIKFSDGSNRYDGLHPDSHPHAVCTRCGRIEDVALTGLTDLSRNAAIASGYQIQNYRVDVYGICPSCQNAN